MDERWDQAWRVLPGYLGAHVVLSAAALALGLLLSLPLALAARRRPGLRWAALAFAGGVQTVPSLALLALFYPLLLALSAATQALFGASFSALGFLPALLALTLYSMLPILRNAITGFAGLDPDVLEAARGVGMTDRQSLWIVEAPLAAPVIMAGVRTAAILVIGTATLATPVGQTSLGDYIFTGLQTENWVLVLFGCVAAVALAFVVDQLLGLVERGMALRDRRRVIVGIGALLVGAAAAIAPMIAGAAATGAAPRAYVIGAKNFSEQFILAEAMAARLRRDGANVTVRQGLGSAIAFRALASGDLDAYVDYSGTLWTNVLERTDTPPRAELTAEMTRLLRERYQVETLGSLGFENAYALAMRRARAEALGVRTIEDLARVAPQLTMGGDLEFFARPEWAKLRDTYGLHFRAQRQFQPTFMYRALSGGEADVISAFSSDGRIAADDLVVLGDPRGAIPPYDAVLLISPRRAHDRAFLDTLRPLIGAISPEHMRRANYAVDRDNDKQTPAQAAEGLIAPAP